MTRTKPRMLDKIRNAFGAVDRTLVDRSDLNDATKIQGLEEKINDMPFENVSNLWKLNPGKINRTSNRKTNLKNSKRY